MHFIKITYGLRNFKVVYSSYAIKIFDLKQ